MNTNHEVLFIDTKYDISSQRMLNMLSACNVLNPNEILQKIKICHSTNAFKLLRDLHHIRTAFSEAEEKYLGFKVIIIDSLSVLFQEFHNFIEGLSVLSNIVQVMNLLVSKYHIVILITNFVTSWTPKSTLEESDCEEFINYFFKVETPALGRYWAHVPTTRIMIKRRGCMDECYLTNLKSRYQPIGKTVKICITEAGVK